jgi:hypothetical protein
MSCAHGETIFRETAMKLLASALLVLTLASCGSGYHKTPAEIARDQAWDDATSSAMVANWFHKPASCTNIGGIVTCQ